MTEAEHLRYLKGLIEARLVLLSSPVIIVDPPPPPPPAPSGAVSLTDQAPHQVTFQSGVPQNFVFNSPGGYIEVTGFSVSGSSAVSATYSVDGGPSDTFTPSGSDFRFKPLSNFVGNGTHVISVTLNGINGGAAVFGLQAFGALG